MVLAMVLVVRSMQGFLFLYTVSKKVSVVLCIASKVDVVASMPDIYACDITANQPITL